MINKVKNCTRCKKYEGTPPIAKLQKLPCSGPGELLLINFTTIEETVGLHKEQIIRNVLVMQDHFSNMLWPMLLRTKRQELQPRLYVADILDCSELQPTCSMTKENLLPLWWWKTFVHCTVSRSSEHPHIMLKPMDKWSV